ncbi:hypothetical protein SESBI_09164 [Sesbania bispinosa]|nr:hypothetical protein SESBI_09164 [Sesbania bispinosa]
MPTTKSLVAKAIMSAQETIPGHSASTRLFILSMKSKALVHHIPEMLDISFSFLT